MLLTTDQHCPTSPRIGESEGEGGGRGRRERKEGEGGGRGSMLAGAAGTGRKVVF